MKTFDEFVAILIFVIGMLAAMMIYVGEGWHKQLAMLTVAACVVAILILKSD